MHTFKKFLLVTALLLLPLKANAYVEIVGSGQTDQGDYYEMWGINYTTLQQTVFLHIEDQNPPWAWISGAVHIGSSGPTLSSLASAGAQVQSDWTQATTSAVDYIKNKPTVPTTFDGLADGTTNKAYTATEKTKLAGIAAGATANSSDATLLNRANHTGTQTLSTISDAGTAAALSVAVSGNASSSQVVKGNDTRLTDSRAPSGTAGGVLTGTYPNPTLSATTVTAGTYNYATISVAGDGRVTAASNGTVPVVQAYDGTTQRLGAFPVFLSGTISGSTVVYQVTANGLSSGASLCPTAPLLNSVSFLENDNSTSYQHAWAWSNSNKTLTVTPTKYTNIANILSGLLGQTAATGVVYATVWCY